MSTGHARRRRGGTRRSNSQHTSYCSTLTERAGRAGAHAARPRNRASAFAARTFSPLAASSGYSNPPAPTRRRHVTMMPRLRVTRRQRKVSGSSWTPRLRTADARCLTSARSSGHSNRVRLDALTASRAPSALGSGRLSTACLQARPRRVLAGVAPSAVPASVRGDGYATFPAATPGLARRSTYSTKGDGRAARRAEPLCGFKSGAGHGIEASRLEVLPGLSLDHVSDDLDARDDEADQEQRRQPSP